MNQNQEMADLLFGQNKYTRDEVLKMYPRRDKNTVVTRFAPSPTGFLHIGGVYTALINRKFASQNNGVFILRIEDTDKKREVKGSKEIILNVFDRFGISVDEGVCLNSEKGKYGPYVQSNRVEIYHAMAKYLVQKGMAYPCFCTEDELNEIRSKQIALKKDPGYYGEFAKYRNITVDEAKKHLANNEPYVLRFRVSDDAPERVVITDLIKGCIEMENNRNDFVLLKEDGVPTYHFAHACDDYLMGTTNVIRSDEWVASLPIHMALFDALEFEMPQYAHVSPIMKLDGESKRKLSKRKDPESSAEYYLEKGYPIRAIYVYLYTLINSNFEEWYTNHFDADLDDFLFSYDSMSTSGALYDLEKLNNISSEIIYSTSPEENAKNAILWAKEFSNDTYNLMVNDEEFVLRLMKTQGPKSSEHRKDLYCYSNFLDVFGIFYDEIYNKNDDTYINAILENIKKEEFDEVFNAFINFFQEQKIGSNKTLKDLSNELNYTNAKKFNNNPGVYRGIVFQFYKALRIALTHKESGISMEDVILCLGYDKVIERLTRTINDFHKNN